MSDTVRQDGVYAILWEVHEHHNSIRKVGIIKAPLQIKQMIAQQLLNEMGYDIQLQPKEEK